MKNFQEEYVSVNGIEHFLLHYPKAPNTPVLLFLHGGPGSFESLFAYELDKAWGDMFTQVHWDQRGAGKTLLRNKKKGLPKTIDQMLDDLHGIIGYLQRKYQVEKVVLLGHSWGTLIGSLYILKHPENVLAYIGVGQVINIRENERVGFQNTLKMAESVKNQKHITALKKLGNYPPSDPEEFLKKMLKLRKIQENYDTGPGSGSGMSELIKSAKRSPSFRWSDFISFLSIAKVNYYLHLKLITFNLYDSAPQYKVPVHYILGDLDTITPTSISKAYFNTIEAPHKTITIVPKAGHNPMYEQPKEFTSALRAVRETL